MSDRRAIGLALALVLLAGMATVGAVGTAAGGDSPTILEVDPKTAEAPPGETIHVGVVLTSDGGYGDDGVERIEFELEYDPDVVTVEEVHHGPWMEQGNETEIVTDHAIDDEAGTVRVEQARDPAEGGATGHDRLATLTVTTAEDADGETSPLNFTETDTELTSQWSVDPYTNDGSVVVDSDADVVEASPPETDDGAEDAEAAGDGDDDGTDDEADTVPGFGVAGALAAAALALVVAVRRRM